MSAHTIYIKDNELWARFVRDCKCNSIAHSVMIERLIREYMSRYINPVDDKD